MAEKRLFDFFSDYLGLTGYWLDELNVDFLEMNLLSFILQLLHKLIIIILNYSILKLIAQLPNLSSN